MVVVIIIPTLNEEEGIGKVINDCKKLNYKKIIVIDGYSTDNTVKIAKSLGAKIIFQEGKGKGLAFQTFLKKYKIKDKDVYILIDGDCSYPVNKIPTFEKLLKKYDIVSGNRKGITSSEALSLLKYFGNKLISLMGLLLYGKFQDICTGMWGIKSSVVNRMKINAKKFDLEANFFINVVKLHLKHTAIPIPYYERIGETKLKVKDGLDIIKYLIKER